MKTLYVLQHTESEFLGLIEDHLEGRGIRFHYFRPFAAGGMLPGTALHADGLVLLPGGPWGTVSGNPLPTLDREVRRTKDFLNRGKPVIGIGLGAQVLCLAAGGGALPEGLRFEVGEARRVADDGLGGFLPASFPLVVYMRDRPLPPAGARVLAVDGEERPALFQIGGCAFGFTGHPGAKPGMLEDLLLEFDEGPEDAAERLSEVRAVEGEIADSLVLLMTGLVRETGLMRPHDERDLARRRRTVTVRG